MFVIIRNKMESIIFKLPGIINSEISLHGNMLTFSATLIVSDELGLSEETDMSNRSLQFLTI